MKISEYNLPELIDKLNNDRYRKPFLFNYISWNMFSAWIKKDRKGFFCICSFGYNHRLYRSIEIFPSYDVLFKSADYEEIQKHFKDIISNHLFFKYQQELDF